MSTYHSLPRNPPRRRQPLRTLGVYWFAFGVLFGTGVAAHGQVYTSYPELFSGKTHPLSLALKDLTPEWRKIVVEAHINVSDNISVNVSGNAHANSQNNLLGALGSSRSYLTKGETVSVRERTYLVAYRLPGGALDIGVLLQAVATKTPPSQAKLTPDSTLTLSLLDLASLGNIEQIRPFDMAAEIRESDKAVSVLAEMFKGESKSGETNAPPAAEKKN